MSSKAQPRAEGAPTLMLPERYQVRRRLATGGMASVWCAEDLVLGRTVAIKVLDKRFAHDDVAVRRFKREARAAARVSTHAHVVTIYDVGDTLPDPEDPYGPGQAFIVMEHLAGGTVADAMRVETINHRETLRWLGEAASALDHAHERGIVHRDIKPANFLLDGHRILHVADFGIARLASEDTITSTGELFGTAAYLAPEQALGREATGASDRYALAVAGFELLTGERPFTAPHFAAQARQHIEDPPPSASERNRLLPEAVDPILARGMAKDPEARYETAGAMVAALEDGLSAPVSRTARPARTARAIAFTERAPHGHARAATTAYREPTPLPSTSATAAAAIVPGEGRRGGHGRALALVALLVGVLAVVAVAVAGLGGSSRPTASTSARSPTTAHAATKPRHHAATTAASSSTTSTQASATSPTTPTTVASASGSSAEQLQLTGHQELLDGNYQQAVSTLRQALSTAPSGSLTYAYALYDLGRTLTLSGDPQGAIPLLKQRLAYHNQTSTVQQALDQAEQAAGQAPAPASQQPQPQSTKPTPPTTPRATHPHAPGNSGGAGLAGPPGHANGNGHGHGG